MLSMVRGTRVLDSASGVGISSSGMVQSFVEENRLHAQKGVLAWCLRANGL